MKILHRFLHGSIHGLVKPAQAQSSASSASSSSPAASKVQPSSSSSLQKSASSSAVVASGAADNSASAASSSSTASAQQQQIHHHGPRELPPHVVKNRLIYTSSCIKELFQRVYILFPVSLVKAIGPYCHQQPNTYFDLIDKLCIMMDNVKFNPRSLLYHEKDLLMELRVEEWKKIDIDRLLLNWERSNASSSCSLDVKQPASSPSASSSVSSVASSITPSSPNNNNNNNNNNLSLNASSALRSDQISINQHFHNNSNNNSIHHHHHYNSSHHYGHPYHHHTFHHFNTGHHHGHHHKRSGSQDVMGMLEASNMINMINKSMNSGSNNEGSVAANELANNVNNNNSSNNNSSSIVDNTSISNNSNNSSSSNANNSNVNNNNNSNNNMSQHVSSNSSNNNSTSSAASSSFSFVTAFSELEHLLQENTPREVWWQRITSLQNWIELIFRKGDLMSAMAASSFSNELPYLQQTILSLRNELLYERVARQQLEEQLQNVNKYSSSSSGSGNLIGGLIGGNSGSGNSSGSSSASSSINNSSGVHSREGSGGSLVNYAQHQMQLQQGSYSSPNSPLQQQQQHQYPIIHAASPALVNHDMWEHQVNVEALIEKNKQQEIEIQKLKQSLQAVRVSERDARARATSWDQKLQSNLSQLQHNQHKLQEENINLKEGLDLSKKQLEQLKAELENKSQRIYELETRVTENNSKLEKLKQSELKLEHLQEEVLMWERSHAKWVNAAKQNKQLTEGIVFRDKVIDALTLRLDLTMDKTRQLTSALHSKAEMLSQAKTESEKHADEIKHHKQLLEYQQANSQEQMATVQKKYALLKEINLELQQQMLKLRNELSEKTAQASS